MREQAPNVCFLMETQLDKEGFDKLYGNLPFQNRIIVKHPNSGGGLALLWKNNVAMEVINYTANHVLTQNKERSWKLLAHLKTFVEGPWLVMEDFNAFLNASEKQNKTPPQTSQIDAFRDALEYCQLEDLGFRCYPFTWSNKRLGSANTKVRLDHAIANKEWIDKYQMSNVTHLSSPALDHLPIIL